MDMDGKADSEKEKRVLIVTGEASGDLHGSSLARALKKVIPSVAIYGVGSERMKKAGVRILCDSKEMAVVGLLEVFSSLAVLIEVFRIVKRFIREEIPDLLILIDFPDFNLMLAKVAKKMKIPVLYYISPQIWAWRQNRVKKIGKLIDQMAVIFPFEIPYYQKEGVPVNFVGHPLIDVAMPSLSREEAIEQFGLDPKRTLIGLFPGSRKSEIKRILPPMIGAARAIKDENPTAQFAIPLAHTIDQEDLSPYLEKGGIDITLVRDSTYDLINASRLVVVASGTATLEAALIGKPMVVVYKTSWINYLLGRMILKVKYLGMVNLVAREGIVPELIQAKLTADGIFREVMDLLKDAERYKKMKEALANVVRKLGEKGASEKVANIAWRMIQDNSSLSSTPKAPFKDEVMPNPKLA